MLRGPALPRVIWLVCALAVIGWQASAGRPGVALLVVAATVPLALLGAERGRGDLDESCEPGSDGSSRPGFWSGRVGFWWLGGALAPVLGLAGLAGAYPAVAGQAATWRRRATLGALGYWWLTLAEPLLGRDLWLGVPPSTPSRAVWEGSLSNAALHVVGPALSLGVLLGATLWALAAMVLPWIVRGRSAAFDVVAATMWCAALATGAQALDSGLSAHVLHPSPRGTALGAILGGVLVVAARALRGPV